MRYKQVRRVSGSEGCDVLPLTQCDNNEQTDKYNHGFISLVSSDYKYGWRHSILFPYHTCHPSERVRLGCDRRWVTRMLISVANSCCDGRVVSVLEGGYNVAGKFVSPFAKVGQI